jgi:hypothetical protein
MTVRKIDPTLFPEQSRICDQTNSKENMSKKSLVSLQKEIIRDGHAPIRERIEALKAMAKPPERFLRMILDSDAPELRRLAARLLVKLLSTPKARTGATALPIPEPSQEAESAIPETGPQTIDPEIWDVLGGFGGNPAFKRGKTASPKAEEPAEAGKTVRSSIPRPKGTFHD